ncbi:LysE family translocator [Alkalibaculum sp. M08DMB]|uniref:LysE family translocator n=1 Tax=Alkalibaculum sporogenes TaxID=2655001 RepID=A0A6A7K4J4_9FIRM|nr:LysE family translocator [Alkalibaculum sporogenes]MPW24308.1 LysE family translocator [Alkalibaculum sporogenes]
MFGIVNYGVFILSAVALNLTPGTDTMYIIGSSMSNDRKSGVLSALGVSSGCIVHTIMAALGLSMILSKSALAFDIIKYIGAGYLIYLGILSFVLKSHLVMKEDKNEKHSNKKIFLRGVLTNVLNPKVALFFLAFLPQFIHSNNTYGTLPFLLLGFTFIITGTIWGIVLATFSSYFGQKLSEKLGESSLLSKISGVIYIGLGLNLLRSKLAN